MQRPTGATSDGVGLFPQHPIATLPKLPNSMVTPLLHFDRDELLVLETALTREWLEVDHLGGYASSTILLCHTRRQHGLLVAVPDGMEKRHLFLSRFEESLHREDRSFPLSVGRYPGSFSPLGHQGIEHFELAPWPSWLYRIGRAGIHREIQMLRGCPAVITRYRIDTPRDDIELRVRPLLPFREHDQLTFENLVLQPRVTRIPGGISCRPYASLPPIALTVEGAEARFEADPVWFRRVEYPLDLRRGFDGHEDQFSPGVFHIMVPAGREFAVAGSLGEALRDPLAAFVKQATERLDRLPEERDLKAMLQHTSEVFTLQRKEVQGIVAGFHWLGENLRDTLLAAPGITLYGKDKPDLHRLGSLLDDAAGRIDVVLRRPTSLRCENDAALWFPWAVRQAERAGVPLEEIRRRYQPVMEALATAYATPDASGRTGLGFRVDNEGLLTTDGSHPCPTWMDAMVDDQPVTPRQGRPVEVNALWYFLLQYLETLHHETGDRLHSLMWMKRRRTAGRSFRKQLWIDTRRYLADVADDDHQDSAVRPNMVIAAALEWSPLTRGKRTDVVQRAEVELLTPRGLRTLAPKNKLYVGRYHGTPSERDAARHQGTVWPWLLGFFVEAWLRSLGADPASITYLRSLLDGFREQLPGQGLLLLSELSDGDPPHRPLGAIARALTQAELLRAYGLLDQAREVAPE